MSTNTPPTSGAHTNATLTNTTDESDDSRGPKRGTFLGSDTERTRRNVSWGSIAAGVVTFFAVTILFSLITIALGLGLPDFTSDQPAEGVGLATGLWSIFSLIVALAAAGFVAGALSVRAGFLHGFLTWATSVLAIVVLSTMAVGNLLGAVGSALGTTASSFGDQIAEVAPDVAGEVQPTADPDEVVEDAREPAEQAANTAASVATWAFFGLLVGALISSFAGVMGSRTVASREDRTDHSRTR